MQKNLVYREKTEGNLSYLEMNSPECFDIDKIFDCGQCFRFNKAENSRHESEYSGIAFGRFLSVAKDGGKIYIYNTTAAEFESRLVHFLALDIDYGTILTDIKSRSDNPALTAALEFGTGIRVLVQDPFETVISFIVSQNNNIPRIKKIIENMSEALGTEIDVSGINLSHLSDNCKYYSFPAADALAASGVDGLFQLRTGFRAKYLYDAAIKFSDGTVNISRLLAEQDTENCISELCRIKGIGRKVASCSLLFGFEKYNAFPIDVWIKKVISKYFLTDPDNFDYKALGTYAGIAQQYLFYYERYGNK